MVDLVCLLYIVEKLYCFWLEVIWVLVVGVGYGGFLVFIVWVCIKVLGWVVEDVEG